jgi:hypothetical protein
MSNPNPIEVTVIYDVPREGLDSWLTHFRRPINDGELLPPNYSAIQAEAIPDPADGPLARIRVVFRPTER